MTTEQQAEYLIKNGWKLSPQLGLWRDTATSYLWEQSAAVRQQQFRDRNRARAEAKADGK